MRFVKVLSLVLLGFSFFCPVVCLGVNVCSDCAQQYASVYALAVSTTNTLQHAKNELYALDSQLSPAESSLHTIINYASLNNGTYDASISGSASYALSRISSARQSVTSALSDIDSAEAQSNQQISILESFNCHCSSNSCGCVSILNDILESVYRIENSMDYVHSIYLSLMSSDYMTTIYDVCADILHRLTVYDDDYKSDLDYLANQLYSRAQFIVSDPKDFASARFAGHRHSNIELGIGYLYTVDYQNMLVNQKTSETLNDILSVISNISVSVTNSSDTTCKWEADLAFISNYLWTIQRRYFDVFNSDYLFKPGSKTPTSDSYNYRSITNAWTILRDSSRLWNKKQEAFNTLKLYGGWQTNWFERIEYALYGIAGFWDTERSFDSSLSEASSITNNYNRLINATNSFSIVSSIFSVSNQAQTVVSEFKNLVDAFHFPSSSMPSATFTLCPSFQIGDFEFSGVAFEMYDIHEVLEAIRTAFQFVWTIGFSIFGIGLAAKFFFYLGNAIRDVFILLKTLL